MPNIYQLSGKTTWGKIILDHSEPGILGVYPQDKKSLIVFSGFVFIRMLVRQIDKANTFMWLGTKMLRIKENIKEAK